MWHEFSRHDPREQVFSPFRNTHMFGFGKAVLELDMHGVHVRFGSVEEFEFALAGRSGIPADKLSRLVNMKDADLLREAEGIRKLEKRFSEILAHALRTGSKLGPILQALDMSLVSQDNDWRTVIDALNLTNDDKFEDHKRVALVKYMQYLQARQDVIRTLYSQRKANREEAAPQTKSPEDKVRETLIFDLSGDAPEGNPSDEMRRLPKGEPVSFNVSASTPLRVKLVKHECVITVDNGLVFIDDTDNSLPLTDGRYAIGRDSECEIPLNPEYRDISRKHLIVDVVGQQQVQLTDVSSLGSFVPTSSIADA